MVTSASESWIPTLDGTTPDSDGKTRTQSSAIPCTSCDEYWTTTSASIMTLDTSNTQLLSNYIGGTGEKALSTKLPFALSITGWQIDWTVILMSGNRNNSNVFLNVASFSGADYKPAPAENNEYASILANTDNDDWMINLRAYPSGSSLQPSVETTAQAGGNQTDSTNYYRLKSDGSALTGQLFSDADRTVQVGTDQVASYTTGVNYNLGVTQYLGIATDDFATNFAVKTITVTNL